MTKEELDIIEHATGRKIKRRATDRSTTSKPGWRWGNAKRK